MFASDLSFRDRKETLSLNFLLLHTYSGEQTVFSSAVILDCFIF